MSNHVSSRSIIHHILSHNLRGRGGLDYVAYAHTHGSEVMEPLIDVSRTQIAELLDRFALGRKAEDQIRLWKGLIPVVHRALCALDQRFALVGQGENVRVVFDIDMGGFYYTRVGGHGFLFAATLNQEEVNSRRCDEEMRNMVAEIEAVCTAYGA